MEENVSLTESRHMTCNGVEEFLVMNNGSSTANIKDVVSVAVITMDEYARINGKSLVEFEQLSTSDFNKFPCGLYAEQRKANGSKYSCGSLVALWNGLWHHFMKTYGIDIISDIDYKSANDRFSAERLKAKGAGKELVMHVEPLSSGDFIRL